MGPRDRQARDQGRYREIRHQYPGCVRDWRYQHLSGQEEADPIGLPRGGTRGLRRSALPLSGQKAVPAIHDHQSGDAKAPRCCQRLMDAPLAELLRLLELERLEVNLFRGESHDIGSPQVFGGQVLGQSLRAAYGTVEPDRIVHSLNAYFLRRGDFNAPIVYFVDRSRDGASFTSR